MPLKWITGGDTGTSSKTIWTVMMGAVPSAPGEFQFGVPHDPSDFGRCYRLLKLFPEWRTRLDEVAHLFPIWGPMVREWDRMTALYEEEMPTGRAPKLYAFMQTLVDEGRILDGWVQTGPGSWTRNNAETQRR